MEGYEATLGATHERTVRCIYNLATVLKEQGKLEEAEALSRRAMEGYEVEEVD